MYEQATQVLTSSAFMCSYLAFSCSQPLFLTLHISSLTAAASPLCRHCRCLFYDRQTQEGGVFLLLS